MDVIRLITIQDFFLVIQTIPEIYSSMKFHSNLLIMPKTNKLIIARNIQKF